MREKQHLMKTSGPILWTWLGRIGYSEALILMESLMGRVEKMEIPGVLLFLEHPPIITLGRRAGPEDVVATQDELVKSGFRVFPADRGGMATCHGPGQLIGYVVIHLGRLGLGIRNFVEKLECMIINVLASMGVKGISVEGMPGVWVQGKKIAALGMRVKDHITSHGFALNVDFNLNAFNFVVPCGMKEIKVANLSELLDVIPSLPELARITAKAFGADFGVEMIEIKEIGMNAEWNEFIESDGARKKGEAA